ncbi:MAG TPA: hypothetical protein VHC70_08655 [Phycisphaerales bacterium]|nr:hypothetical protein [Phycisphaerales bacterium]
MFDAANRRSVGRVRRLIGRALLLLALGVVTTIVAAGALSALASHWDPDKVPARLELVERQQSVCFVFLAWPQRWPGVSIFPWEFDHTSADCWPNAGSTATPPNSFDGEAAPRWSCLRDETSRHASQNVKAGIRLFADWRAGWPLAALRGRLTPASLTDAQSNQFRPPWNGGEGMLRFRDATPRISIGDGLWLTGHLFPLIPIWPNFLIDAALYAAGWWGVLLAAGRVRVVVRRRRDRCVGCGYDVRSLPAGAPCPECGRAR